MYRAWVSRPNRAAVWSRATTWMKRWRTVRSDWRNSTTSAGGCGSWTWCPRTARRSSWTKFSKQKRWSQLRFHLRRFGFSTYTSLISYRWWSSIISFDKIKIGFLFIIITVSTNVQWKGFIRSYNSSVCHGHFPLVITDLLSIIWFISKVLIMYYVKESRWNWVSCQVKLSKIRWN